MSERWQVRIRFQGPPFPEVVKYTVIHGPDGKPQVWAPPWQGADVDVVPADPKETP